MKLLVEGGSPLRKAIRQDLVRDEGVRLYPYRDHLGYVTIGIGRNVSYRRDWISPKTAFDMLDEDLDVVEDEAKKIFPTFLSFSLQRQRAILNMLFQLGANRFLKFKKMIAAIRADDWATAQAEARDSNWFRDPRLRARALRVIKLMEESNEDDSATKL